MKNKTIIAQAKNTQINIFEYQKEVNEYHKELVKAFSMADVPMINKLNSRITIARKEIGRLKGQLYRIEEKIMEEILNGD